MKKEVLDYIKKDIRDLQDSKRFLRADLKALRNEMEERYKEEIKRNNRYSDKDTRALMNQMTNDRFKKEDIKRTWETIECYHNSQSYYFIYNDGSEATISAEDILGGEKLPKMRGIVYAELLDGDNWIDTENGDLNGKFEDEDEFYDPDLFYEYINAINYKFQTNWALQYKKEHPDYVPAVSVE